MNLNQLSDQMQLLIDTKEWNKPGGSRPQTAKNIAISIMLEAAEILEHFQWNEHPSSTQDLALELADVQLYLLQLARICKIDLEQACIQKLEINHNRTWKN